MLHRTSPLPTAKLIAVVVFMVATVSGVKPNEFRTLESFNPFYHGQGIKEEKPLHNMQEQDYEDEVDQGHRVKLIGLLKRIAGTGNMWIPKDQRRFEVLSNE